MPIANFNPELSTGLAISMTLLAAFLWGTWFVSLKYLGDYPLDGFYITLFTTSLLFVWTVGFIIEGSALYQNIARVFSQTPSRVWVTVLCGILYVLGIRITLYVFQIIGFSLAQPIQSSITILIGTWLAAVIGGIPPNMSVPLVITGCLLLVLAVFATILAAKYRTDAEGTKQMSSHLHFSMREIWQSVILLVISSFLAPAYTFGLSYGLRSITQPIGLAVLPFMALLATGAFIGSALSSGLLLTVRKQWGRVLRASMSIHKFGMISAIFHYGGNIIHTYATVSLSSVISWPLGVTYGLWTQVWGIAYGEFRGAPRKTYYALAGGILLYLIGAYLIASSSW